MKSGEEDSGQEATNASSTSPEVEQPAADPAAQNETPHASQPSTESASIDPEAENILKQAGQDVSKTLFKDSDKEDQSA